jgi:ribosome maturation protein SDO1
MTESEARLKKKGKNFEILVDVDKALQLKKGENVNIQNVLVVNQVFDDSKKGLKSSNDDMEDVFGTSEVGEVAEKIIKQGELVLPAEYKKKDQEKILKRIVNFISKHAVNPKTGNPHTEERIKEAIKEGNIEIKNKPVEEQVGEIVSELKKVIPIKLETKKLKVTVPAASTGKAYGLLKQYKEEEEWLGNGDLKCLISIPAGMQIEFYDKLNSLTQGSAVVEEIKSGQ